ncbi:cyclophilin-like fold protein [Desulfogranum japonicum]|uniref:cyclophilin-like fold protein n=1 Tax=Desulfogranum japonicum TaxID=231447 RepID=UPI001427B6DB|nr:cyclophilin-like fold protein [Desulfogranum japonicum]
MSVRFLLSGTINLTKLTKTLWAGFALETSERSIFFSGDSGYGPHFSELGQTFNGFDLVLLDCGQYDPRWSYIHMPPGRGLTSCPGSWSPRSYPAHVGRFTIANHSWDEPFMRIQAGTLAYYAPWGDVVMFYKKFGSASGLYELGQAVSGSENIEKISGKIEILKSSGE